MMHPARDGLMKLSTDAIDCYADELPIYSAVKSISFANVNGGRPLMARCPH